MTAIQMAMDDVHARPDILDGYILHYEYIDSMVMFCFFITIIRNKGLLFLLFRAVLSIFSSFHFFNLIILY